ncbi:MAG: hypothetical protein AAF696_20450 [Bacteroidota bacterium]
MLKYLIQLFLICSFSSCSSPSHEKVMSHWPNGQIKQLKVYSSLEEVDGPNYVESYFHENGQLESRGEYQGNEKIGIWQSWYANGQIKTESTYLNGRKEGSFKQYFPNGQLAELSHYQEDKFQGLYESWDETASLLKKGQYQLSRKLGIWIEMEPEQGLYKVSRYNDSGILVQEMSCKEQEAKTLYWMHAYDDGELAEQGQYQFNFALVSLFTEFSDQAPHELFDVLIQKIVKEGQKKGSWLHYYHQGSQMKEVVYSLGERELKSYWYESGFQAVDNGEGQIEIDSAGFSYLDSFQAELEAHGQYENGKLKQ